MTATTTNKPRKKRNTRTVNLVLAIDFGGSLTKLVGGISQNQYVAMTMEPEVVEVTEGGIRLHEKNAIGSGRPKDRSWVKLNGKVYAVGYLARQFLGDAGLWKAKTEIAIQKLLAALWVMKRHWSKQLGNKRIRIDLACLLPPGEYQEKTEFEASVREALEGFESPDGKMMISCNNFYCFPEGFGVLSNFEYQWGQDFLKNKVCAVVMLGHRNSSLMVCHRGRVNQFDSSELGFIQLVRKVIQRTAGLEETSLSEAIAMAGHDIDPHYLEPVLRHQDPVMRKQELENLIEAISISRQEYLILLQEWILKTIPSTVTEVVLCGGTADYLEELPALSQFRLYQPGDIKVPYLFSQLNIGNRMTDVAGLWDWTIERSFPVSKKTI